MFGHFGIYKLYRAQSCFVISLSPSSLLFNHFWCNWPSLGGLQTGETRGPFPAEQGTSPFQNRHNPRPSRETRALKSVQVNHELSLNMFAPKNRRSRNNLGQKIQFPDEIALSFFLWLHPRWRRHWVAQVHYWPSPAFPRPANSKSGHLETRPCCRRWLFKLHFKPRDINQCFKK